MLLGCFGVGGHSGRCRMEYFEGGRSCGRDIAGSSANLVVGLNIELDFFAGEGTDSLIFVSDAVMRE